MLCCVIGAVGFRGGLRRAGDGIGAVALRVPGTVSSAEKSDGWVPIVCSCSLN